MAATKEDRKDQIERKGKERKGKEDGDGDGCMRCNAMQCSCRVSGKVRWYYLRCTYRTSVFYSDAERICKKIDKSRQMGIGGQGTLLFLPFASLSLFGLLQVGFPPLSTSLRWMDDGLSD